MAIAKGSASRAERWARITYNPAVRSAECTVIRSRERSIMSTTRKVAVIVGSLRKESFSRKMAKAMIAMAPPSLKLEIVEIGQVPHYNQDFDADPPQEAKDFKGRIQEADAVLFVTPEY